MNFSTVANLFRREPDYYRFKTEAPTVEPGHYMISRRPRSNFIRVTRCDGSSKTFRADAQMAAKLRAIGVPLRAQDAILTKVWNFGHQIVKVKNAETWGGTETAQG